MGLEAKMDFGPTGTTIRQIAKLQRMQDLQADGPTIIINDDWRMQDEPVLQE